MLSPFRGGGGDCVQCTSKTWIHIAMLAGVYTPGRATQVIQVEG